MAQALFRVATFNAYNLVVGEQVYYGNRKYSQRDYERKIDWMARQMREMDADIVGFQEIFHGQALRDALLKSDVYDSNTALMTVRSGGNLPNTALLSRFPVIARGAVVAFPEAVRLDYDGRALPITRFSKPVLWARLAVRSDLHLTVFVAHLKSKRPMIASGEDEEDPMVEAVGMAKSLIMRSAEAIALRYLLMQTLQDRTHPVIVLGDINDAATAVTSQIVSGTPPWHRLSKARQEAIGDVLLHNVKDIQARQSYRDVYYTHLYNGHYEALDHILVSREFVRENPNHCGYVEHVRVYNDHLVDQTITRDDIPNWRSDHGYVLATIRFASGAATTAGDTDDASS